MMRHQYGAGHKGKAVKVRGKTDHPGCSSAHLLLCRMGLHPASPDATQSPSAVAGTQLLADAAASAAGQGR